MCHRCEGVKCNLGACAVADWGSLATCEVHDNIPTQVVMEKLGIDPSTSRMLSERSTI